MYKDLTIEFEYSSNSAKFNYYFDGGEFCHVLKIPQGFVLKRPENSFARIAVLSRPVNAERIFLPNNLMLDVLSHYSFEKTTKSNINCFIDDNHSYDFKYNNLPDKIRLAFSGGFDSVCALALIEDKARLFSIDFLGYFKRERDFFQDFHTDIFEWDIRQPLKNNFPFNEGLDYRFLISPATLYLSEELNGVVTGTVLEASEFQYTSNKRNNFLAYNPDVYGSGLVPIPFVTSLSEYCTAKIAFNYLGENRINDSLRSLAFENSFKNYRKKCLVAAVLNKGIPEKPKNIERHIFGKYLADDIISLYFVWKFGYEAVLSNFCDGIDYKLIKDVDMSFFERANDNNLLVVDPVLRNLIISKLNFYGISLYKSGDLDLLERSLHLRRLIIESQTSNE